MDEKRAISLHATGKPVNGHSSVQVTPGGPDEAYWRERGYVLAEELAGAESGVRLAEPNVEEPAVESAPPVESAAEPKPEPPAPKRRRGRPRKAQG